MRRLKRVLKRLLGRTQDEQPWGERDSLWYDRAFEQNQHWREHYTKSSYYFLWTVIADRLVRRGVGSILDIGCGSGQLARLLSDKGIRQYCGLDFSEKRIAQARLVCPDFEFRNEDAFKSDAFDVCDYDCLLTTEFLEHVESDIEAIRRVKPGVYFIGTVPNFPWKSHVRHFADADAVQDRYGDLFTDFSVDFFYGNDRGKTFFLLEGIVRPAAENAVRETSAEPIRLVT